MWCKSKDEIDDFLRKHPQFFVHMKTMIQEDIFPDHPLVDQFPYNGDSENYFPTVNEPSSIKFGAIDVDSQQRDSQFLIEDIATTYNSIRLIDDPWEIA